MFEHRKQQLCLKFAFVCLCDTKNELNSLTTTDGLLFSHCHAVPDI